MRNIIHPGWIISQSDGDRHYIGFVQLVRLYKLDPRTCYLVDGTYGEREDDKHFYPREDGNYA